MSGRAEHRVVKGAGGHDYGSESKFVRGEQKSEMATLAKKKKEKFSFRSWPEFVLDASDVTLLFGKRCTLVRLDPESPAAS